MTIALIICIPVTALVVGFFVLKSVQLGLKWNIETKQGNKPEMEVNPVKPIVEAVQQNKEDKAVQYSKDQLREWMFGE